MAKALNRFLKDRPSGEEIQKMRAEIKNDGPRGATMVATAIIEDLLVGAIRFRMVSLTDDEADSSLLPDRPLGTFSSRIKIAHALGVFGPKTRHDLNVFRDIRNAFAHARRQIDFNVPEVATFVGTFNSLNDVTDHAKLSAREQFVEVSNILMLHLVTKIGPFPSGITKLEIEGLNSLD